MGQFFGKHKTKFNNKIYPYTKPSSVDLIGLTFETARRKMKLENIILKIAIIDNHKQLVELTSSEKKSDIIYVGVHSNKNIYGLNQYIIDSVSNSY